MNKIKTIVIPVAGMGTRFLPATKVVPKEMLTILDRPLLDYAVSESLKAGIEKFIFITNKDNKFPKSYLSKNKKLEKYLSSKKKQAVLKKINKININSKNIKIIVQDKPLGLGHAIFKTKALLNNEDFAVILPDDLILGNNCIKELINVYYEEDTNVLAVMEVNKKDVGKYGVIDPKKRNKKKIEVGSMVEKPLSKPPSNLAVVGRYILKTSIFDELKNLKSGSGGEIQLTDALSCSIKNERLFAYLFTGNRYDCGSKKGFFQAQVACALQDNEIKKDVKRLISDELLRKGTVLK